MTWAEDGRIEGSLIYVQKYEVVLASNLCLPTVHASNLLGASNAARGVRLQTVLKHNGCFGGKEKALHIRQQTSRQTQEGKELCRSETRTGETLIFKRLRREALD